MSELWGSGRRLPQKMMCLLGALHLPPSRLAPGQQHQDLASSNYNLSPTLILIKKTHLIIIIDYSFCHSLKLKFILHTSERELFKVFGTGFDVSL